MKSGSKRALLISGRSSWIRRGVFSAAVLTLMVPLVTLFQGSAANAADTLISQSKPVATSSIESANFPATAVNDGNLTTRWGSTWADPQWIQIDLQGPATISQVVLNWEAAYAKSYQVQTSPDAITWTPVYSTTTGAGGAVTINTTASGRYVRVYATQRATTWGDSLYEFRVYGTVTTSTTGYVPANPQVTGVTPSQYTPPNAYFHEFQANCAANHELPDDPIVKYAQPGASHMHTFLGNSSTFASSTLASLQAGGTTCLAPGDKSGYWMPTLYNGSQAVDPVGPQVIYYKSGVIDYTSVRAFPPGLRYVVGSPTATATDFATNPGYVAGWECGNSYNTTDFPANCPAGTQLNIRLQSPSCWDGLYLDVPDHKSNMAYPVNGRCPNDHPVAAR